MRLGPDVMRFNGSLTAYRLFLSESGEIVEATEASVFKGAQFYWLYKNDIYVNFGDTTVRKVYGNE